MHKLRTGAKENILMSNNDNFYPSIYLRSGYIQTILASNKIRSRGSNPMVDEAQEYIFDVGDGVRLQGFFSPQKDRPARGIVVMLPGWEGNAGSCYMLTTGRYLYQRGYDIFRLNYRDHGETHYLNEDIFYAALLDEVFESVRQGIALGSGLPAFILGFSLGGNFALRIACRCASAPLEYLREIVAISPLINPDKSTTRVDETWLFRWYFLKKWKRSLARKQQLFPHLYDFHEVLSKNTLREATELLIHQFGVYQGALDYFMTYTLTNGALKDITVPTTIITSSDDPVIPIEDFYQLKLNKLTRLDIQNYGGHCGFLEKFPVPVWYEPKLVDIFEKSIQD